MIKHHPTFELISGYVNGELPASLSAGISLHAQLCPACQQTIDELTEQLAENSFEQNKAIEAERSNDESHSLEAQFEQMMQDITLSDDIAVAKPAAPITINYKDKTYQLPTALRNMQLGKTSHIGKLSRNRIQLDEGEIHTSLLHIEPGGAVPEHTHNGFELTVLLEGSFSDENGEYVKGDFIMLDNRHQHHPISEQGCLCYTVANDALHFTQGINKLLNPIAGFIY